MVRTEDILLPAIEQLEPAFAEPVAGRERDWAARVAQALTAAEAALRRHAAEAKNPDGLFAEVDLTRPSLTRQVSALRREHTDLVDQVRALRDDVRQAALTFTPPAEQVVRASALPEPARSSGIPDFGALRKRGADLVAALRQHRELETDLVQESVTTDLGAGD